MATRTYYDGKDVFFFIKRGTDNAFRVVACLDSNSFSHERELKEVTNKCTGGYRDGVAGKGTWSIDLSGQAISDVETAEANFQELLEISVSGEKIQGKMANAAGTVYMAGEGLITSFSAEANSEDPMSFNASFSGLGVPVIEAPAP